MSSAGLEFLPQVLFTLNSASRFRNERFRELENRFQNCRGLAHFAESSEQNVLVPFSEACQQLETSTLGITTREGFVIIGGVILQPTAGIEHG